MLLMRQPPIRLRYGWSSPERRLARAIAIRVGESRGEAWIPMQHLADRAGVETSTVCELLQEDPSRAVIRRIIARDMYAVDYAVDSDGWCRAWAT